MFEKLTINSQNRFSDPGLLSESLLFYQKTNIIIDPGGMENFLRYCGYANLVELVRSNQLDINYSSDSLGGGHYKDNIFMISSFKSDNHNKRKVLKDICKKIYRKDARNKYMYRNLNKIIGVHEYSQDYIDLLKKELDDKENLISAISIVTEGKLNNKNIEIDKIEEITSGFYKIESNIETQIIADAAFLIATGTGEIYDAEIHKSGIVTNYKRSNYAENRIKRVIENRLEDEKQIDAFHEFVFPTYYDLKGTINGGSKKFNDFMELWRVARDFKHWLKDAEPDVQLLAEYINEIKDKTWLQTLPAKNLRWLLFATIGTMLGDATGGVAGVAASLATDYFDDLILDKLINEATEIKNIFGAISQKTKTHK